MNDLRPSTWQVFKSVMASFFGVQNEQTRQRDFSHGRPGQFIGSGLMLTGAFIAIIYLTVQVILYFALHV